MVSEQGFGLEVCNLTRYMWEFISITSDILPKQNLYKVPCHFHGEYSLNNTRTSVSCYSDNGPVFQVGVTYLNPVITVN